MRIKTSLLGSMTIGLLVFTSIQGVANAATKTTSKKMPTRTVTRIVKSSSSKSSSSKRSALLVPNGQYGTYTACTKDAWSCVPGIVCSNNQRDNVCALLDRTCLNPKAVQPPKTLPCGVSSSSASSVQSTLQHMQENMDKWTEARKDLTAKMEKMSMQPAGRGCLETLAKIDADWVNNYNNYVSLYNNYKPTGGTEMAMTTPERQMQDVIEKIRTAPTFCY